MSMGVSRCLLLALLGVFLWPVSALSREAHKAEAAPIKFEQARFNQELGNGHLYFMAHDYTPAEDRFLPPPRHLKPAPFLSFELRPDIETYNIKHYRDLQRKYPKYQKGKPAFGSKELMLKEKDRLGQQRVVRLSYGGQTRYLWGSRHSDTHVVYTGDTRFYGLTSGKHTVQATLWLENGYRFDGDFTVTVDAVDPRQVKSLEEDESRDLPRSRQRAERANARFNDWTGHLRALLKYVPDAVKYQGRTPEQLQPYFDEIYAMVAGIPTFEAERHWRSQNDRETWESYRTRQYDHYLSEYANLIARYGGRDRLWEALDYANQLEAVGRWPNGLLGRVANSYYGYTGDHLMTRVLLQRSFDNSMRVARDNQARGNFFGSAFVDHRKDWPKLLMPYQERGPVVVLEPPPEPETAAVDTAVPLADDALERIRRMDEILSGVEERLQAGLLEIQLKTQGAAEIRLTMKELSKRRGDEQDPALKKKMQERVNANRRLLKDSADERRAEVAQLTALMRETVTRVQALYEPGGFGEVEPHARTRMDAALARQRMLEMQIALAQGLPGEAIVLARAQRLEYRMGGISYYIEGMAHLQNNDPASALDTFRMARERNLESPGQGFEALVRATEVRILRTLQRMSRLSEQQFRADYDRWIGNKANLHLEEQDAVWSEYVWDAVANRGWYDTVSGVFGAQEAQARGDEVATVADDMAKNYLGLNVLAELRKHYPLDTIRGMNADQFKAALAARWPDREISEEQAQRMRAVAVHAFQIPDVQVVAGGDTLGAGDILSAPLVRRLQAENLVDHVWSRGWELAAEGGNTLINGWSVFTTLAPSAKLSMLKHSGKLRGYRQATAELENVASLGEWFTASTPMQKALESMAKTKAGQHALQVAAKVHDISEDSLRGAIAVNAGNFAAGYAANQMVNKHLGKEAALLFDLFSMVGGASPEVYGKAYKQMSMHADEAAAVAGNMRRLAQSTARQASQLDDVLARTRQALDGPPNPALVAELRQTLQALPDLPPEATRRAAAALDAMENGATVSARQSLTDLERAGQRLTTRARQAEAMAEGMEQAAATLPAPTAATRQAPPGATRQAASAPAGVTRRAEGAAPPAAGPRATVVPLEAGGVGNPAGPTRAGIQDAAGNAAVGEAVPGAEATGALPDPAYINESYPLRERLGQGRFTADAGNPLYPADRALLNGKFDEALNEYQVLLTRHGDDAALIRQLEEKIQLARRQQALAAQRVAGQAEGGPRLHDGSGKANLKQVEAIVAGEQPGAFIKVSQHAGTGGSASEPWFVVDEHGKTLAVVKKAVGFGGHPEGAIEEMASLLSERLNRGGVPRTRQHVLQRPGSPAPERMIVTEIMPEGPELKAAALSPAQLLRHKDEIAEDFVFSTFLGDGDRHFGNYRVASDGRLIPFDYGLADVLPNHGRYRNALYGELAETVRQNQDELVRLKSQLANLPEGGQRHADLEALVQRTEGDIRINTFNRDVNSLYHDANFPTPPTVDSPAFRDYVKAQMRRHIKHGTRGWDAQGGVLADGIGLETLSPHLEKLRGRLDSGAIDEIVDRAFANGPHKGYTKQLLKTRLEVMEEVLEEFFPRMPPALSAKILPWPLRPAQASRPPLWAWDLRLAA
ncbi:MAG: hypothetical protein Q8M09_12545 [Pseudomonadota bacterium]|nr:hypothetical protein [Pseudomonadota bacterium]MDP1905056.1 hypothetical protein [Pseudomonadota bacterium]MDP2351184.1 hypothetical protein [Pseudomonadota bacterium]